MQGGVEFIYFKYTSGRRPVETTKHERDSRDEDHMTEDKTRTKFNIPKYLDYSFLIRSVNNIVEQQISGTVE